MINVNKLSRSATLRGAGMGLLILAMVTGAGAANAQGAADQVPAMTKALDGRTTHVAAPQNMRDGNLYYWHSNVPLPPDNSDFGARGSG